MRKALIETATGLVENIIEIKDGATYDPGAGRELRDADGAQTGGMWNGAKYLPPPKVLLPPPRFESQAKAIESATSLDELKAALATVTRAL